MSDLSLFSDSDVSESSSRTVLLAWQEFLILEVKECPILYDKKDANYMRQDLREGCWQKIANTMKLNGYDKIKGQAVDSKACETKWGNIRDAFRKQNEKVKRAARSGASGKNLPQSYKYAQQLQWYKDVNKKRITKTNNPKTSVDLPGPSTSLITQQPRPIMEQTPTCPSKPPSPPRKQRKLVHRPSMSSSLDEAIQINMEHATEMLKTAISEPERNNTKPEDENDTFGKLIAHSIRTIEPGIEKEELKLNIQQLVLSVKKRQAAPPQPQYPQQYAQQHYPQQYNSSAEQPTFTSFLNLP